MVRRNFWIDLTDIRSVLHICYTYFFNLFPDFIFHLRVYFWIWSEYLRLEYEVFDDLKFKELVQKQLVQKLPFFE